MLKVRNTIIIQGNSGVQVGDLETTNTIIYIYSLTMKIFTVVKKIKLNFEKNVQELDSDNEIQVCEGMSKNTEAESWKVHFEATSKHVSWDCNRRWC